MPLPLVGAHAVLEGMPEFSHNADIVNSKIGGIQTKMSGMGGIAQKAGGLVGGAFKAMAAAGVASVAGIGAVGGGLLKLAYDASLLPGIESVFKNMTTSMGVDADALMGKLRDASYGAVKDFDLMKSANKAMVGAGGEFGKMFAESLPTLMKVSREAAKAQGLSVEYMYDSIVTGIKRMSPMILDNLGFQLSMTEANEKYAASVGKTSKELTKEEKQMALLNEVMRAGTQLIDETGGHIDSVQKDVIAWGTAFKNIKDRVGIELVPVLQKFMDLIGKPSQGMQDAIVNVAKSFVNNLIPAIDKVTMAISVILSGPLALLIKGLANIGIGGLTTIGDTLSGVLTGKEISGADFGAVIEKALTAALGADLAKRIGDAAGKIAEAVQGGLAPIRDVVSEVVDYVRPRLEMLVTYFQMFVSGVIDAFRGKGIQKALDAIKGSMMALFGIETAQMIIGFGSKFKWISDFIVEHSDIIMSALKGLAIYLAGKELIGGFSTLAQTAKLAFGGVGKSALGLLSPLGLLGLGVVGFTIAWDKNWFGIRDKTTAILADIEEALPSAQDALSGFVSLIGAQFSGDLVAAGDASLKMTEGLYGIGLAFGMTSDQANVFSQTVSDAVSGVVNWFTNLYDTVAPIITNIIDTISGLFAGGVGGGITDIFAGLFDEETMASITEIGGLIGEILPQIGELITNVFNTILAVAVAVWPYVKDIITTVWNAIVEVVKIFINDILPPLLEGFLAVLTWVNDNWPAIQAVIVDVFTVIASIIKTVVDTVIPYVVEVFQGLVDWVTANWPMIQETIGVVMQFISDVITIVLGNIAVFWQEHGDNIIAIVTAVWDLIKTIIDTAIRLIKDIITLVMAVIRGDWDTAWYAIKDIALAVWELIKKVVDDAIKIVANVLDIAMGLIKLSWDSAWGVIVLVLTNTWDSITGLIDRKINASKKMIDDGLNDIKKIWNDIWTGLADTVENVWNDIVGFVCSGINRAVGLINNLIDAANKVPGVELPTLGDLDCSAAMLAAGGILNKPTFVAGEAGAEVVAPLTSLLGMIKSGLVEAVTDLAYRATPTMYSGPQPSNTYNYGGDTYIREYNLTTQSMIRSGALAMEFSAMELAHA